MKKNLFTPFFIIISLLALLFLFLLFGYRGLLFSVIPETIAEQAPIGQIENVNIPKSGDLLISPGTINNTNITAFPKINLDDPILGNPNAPITIFEYSNLEVRQSNAIALDLKKILKEYPDKVAIIWKDYIIKELYPSAKKLGLSAYCAKAQNKFWEYHDLALKYINQEKVLDDDIAISSLSLDSGEFKACLKNINLENYFNSVQDEAKSLKITNIPTLFINNQPLNTNINFETIKNIIDQDPSVCGN